MDKRRIEMEKNKLKKNQIIIVMVTTAAILAVLFALSRNFHILLHIGDSYKFCYSTEYRVDGNPNVNDDTISEIKFMKNLKHFAALNTNLTNIDFITGFTKLESLSACGDPDNPESIIKNIPELEKLVDLKYVYLFYVDLENLDFLSDCDDLETLTVVTHGSEITDISGLKNKQKLRFISLKSVNCSDYSVLLELPSLEYLEIDTSEIPVEIKNKLLNRNIKINENKLLTCLPHERDEDL